MVIYTPVLWYKTLLELYGVNAFITAGDLDGSNGTLQNRCHLLAEFSVVLGNLHEQIMDPYKWLSNHHLPLITTINCWQNNFNPFSTYYSAMSQLCSKIILKIVAV